MIPNAHRALELFETLKAHDQPVSAWDISTQAFAEFGVLGMGYGVMPSAREAHEFGNTTATYFRHSYSSEWEHAVSSAPALDYDPTTDRLLAGHQVTFWQDDNLLVEHKRPEPDIDAIRQQTAAEREAGMRSGMTLLLNHASSGGPMVGLGLWFDDTEIPNEAPYWLDHGHTIQHIANLFDQFYRRNMPENIVPLSVRERDCLSYVAAGFRPKRISWRLGTSTKTVEKQIESARKKLRASTTSQAVAKALILNLIQP